MADTVLTDLKIHDFDSLAQMSQHESEIGDNDLVFTPDLSCRLPLLTPMWFDHIANDVSWLRADTFSWHSGDVYKAAYEHLVGDCPPLYAWYSEAVGVTFYTDVETPSVGDDVYNENGEQMTHAYQITGVSDGKIFINSQIYAVRSASRDAVNCEQASDTIGDITITYYTAEDGHKICLPDQESNLVALYESTGVAWYYILDTENKQFKLPRTKWGFTGLRDSVGGYVAPGLPNITGTLGEDQQARNPGNMVGDGVFQSLGQMNGKDSDGSSATRSWGVSFDASRSSSIYGNSDTVQPPATQMYLYFYVGNFEQEAVEQTAGLNAEMFNGKADIDGGNCSEFFSKFSMPSGTYKDLTLGASGNSYTAPADGWVAVSKISSGNQYMSLFCNNLVDTVNVTVGAYGTVLLPVKKGDTFKVTYTLGGATNYFRFIYAEGCKHLA